MPINKDGIIQPKQKKRNWNIKNISLIITTCVSVLGSFAMLYENRLQSLEYKREIQELELEKDKYRNILKENKIQLKNSYITCHVNYIESLYESLGSENNIKILSNDITKKFYNDKKKYYYSAKDIVSKDKALKRKYGYAYPEVVFLKIEVVSNRLVKDVTIRFIKIIAENDIDDTFRT